MDERLETATFGVRLVPLNERKEEAKYCMPLVITANPHKPRRTTWADVIRATSGTDAADAEETALELTAILHLPTTSAERPADTSLAAPLWDVPAVRQLGGQLATTLAYCALWAQQAISVHTYGLPPDLDAAMQPKITQAVGGALHMVREIHASTV